MQRRECVVVVAERKIINDIHIWLFRWERRLGKRETDNAMFSSFSL